MSLNVRLMVAAGVRCGGSWGEDEHGALDVMSRFGLCFFGAPPGREEDKCKDCGKGS